MMSCAPLNRRKETMRKSARALFTVASALSLVLVGCASGAGSGPAGDPIEGGTIHWATQASNLDQGHMDPHKSQSDVSAMINRLTLDSLTYLDKDGNLHPWLASDWEISDDQKSVTFTLREQVTFHDGEPFDAEAVKANFDHVMAPETESTHANNLLGGELYKSTEVVDDHTVTVHFSQPYSPFLNNTSSAFLGIYSPRVLKEHASELASGGPGISVGSGAWKMVELQPGSSIVYERNDDYAWAPEGIEIRDNLAGVLEVSVVPDDQLRAESLNAGEIEIASELSPSAVDTLENEDVTSKPSPGVPYSLYLNEAHGVLEDQNVRQALMYGADIESAVESIYLGYYTRAESLLSPTTPNITSDLLDGTTEFSPQRAEKLLDEAGWKLPEDGSVREKDGQKLEIEWLSWTPREDDKQAIADLLVSDWKKIGVEVTNSVLEPGAYNEKYGPGEYDIVDWSFASIDPDILRNHLSTDGFQNASHVTSTGIDQQLNEAVASFDSEERTKIYDNLQEWNHEYVAILPLFNQSTMSASNTGIAGVEFDGNGWPNFISAQQLQAN